MTHRIAVVKMRHEKKDVWIAMVMAEGLHLAISRMATRTVAMASLIRTIEDHARITAPHMVLDPVTMIEPGREAEAGVDHTDE